MQHYSSSLERDVADDVASLRARFPATHIEWDLDQHDRFVIIDVIFDPDEARVGWLNALSEALDARRLKALCDLNGARSEVTEAFEEAGYEFDSQGTAHRQGLCLRNEKKEKSIVRWVREIDRRFQDIHFEWRFDQDGALVLEHLECARAHPDERVEVYLREVGELLTENATNLRVDPDARTEWLAERLEEAEFVASTEEEGLFVSTATMPAPPWSKPA